MKKKLFVLTLALVMLLSVVGIASASHTVTAGDNLSKIAEQYLGDSSKWKEIYEANKETISDPNLIYVGQELIIPGAESAENAGSEAQTVPLAQPSEGLRVAIIGSGTPIPNPQRGGGSALIQYKDTYILVDCGNGATHTLVKNGLMPSAVEYVFFTHQHNDHNADWPSVFYDGWQTGRKALTLAGPGVQKMYDLTLEFYAEDIADRETTVGGVGATSNVTIYDFTKETESFTIGEIQVEAIEVPHSVVTYAYRFTAGGKSIVISGDLIYSETFNEWAKDADILVIDAFNATDNGTLTPEQIEKMKKTDSVKQPHMTNDEIAQTLAITQPKKVVLTHVGKAIRADAGEIYAAAGFKGETIGAYDGLIVEP